MGQSQSKDDTKTWQGSSSLKYAVSSQSRAQVSHCVNEKELLSLLLMGKTGHGRSSLGNSILGCQTFEVIHGTCSSQAEIVCAYSDFERFSLKVVDVPGLHATHLTEFEDTERAVRNMSIALTMCSEGIDAFLYVFSCLARFVSQEVSVLETLKLIFGKDYFKHAIVVFTTGDYLDGKDITFDDWWRKQRGPFRELYKACNGRFVVFNNRERDEEKQIAQREKLTQLVCDLKRRHGCYTVDCFKRAASERQRLITTMKQQILHEEIQRQDEKEILSFLLMGKTGHGKSSLGNSLLGWETFKVSNDTSSQTAEIVCGYSDFESYSLKVVDGPGLQDTKLSKLEDRERTVRNMGIALTMCSEGVDAFLFVFRFDIGFTEEMSALETLKAIFGKDYVKHVIVVLTYGDLFETEDISFDEWCKKQTGPFRELCKACKGRCVWFNNKEKDKEKQREQLTQLAYDLKRSHGRYTADCFKRAASERQRLITTMKEPILKEEIQRQDEKEVLSLLLMGKTGHGKSSLGNILLGCETFKVCSDTSSLTAEVVCGFSGFESYSLKVVDGPGLQDTELSKLEDTEKAVHNISKALMMCSTGVDAFLFVFRFGTRFTEEEVSALETLKAIFGQDYFKHTIVVFTYGDLFDMEDMTFDDWCKKQTGPFRELYKACNGRCILFNNKERNEEKQIEQREQLTQLAYDLKRRHGCYTADCFKLAASERQRLIITMNEPILKEEIQRQAGILN